MFTHVKIAPQIFFYITEKRLCMRVSDKEEGDTNDVDKKTKRKIFNLGVILLVENFV